MADESEKNRVTLDTVAQRAGVGRGTASRALNNMAGVKPATKEKVLDAARELGYVARPALAALASMRRGQSGGGESAGETVLVAVLSRRAGGGVYDGRKLCDRLNDLGRQRGFSFRYFATWEEASPVALGQRLRQTGFLGVLLFQILDDPAWFRDFPWEHFAAVSLDAAFQECPMYIIRESQFDTVLGTCEKIKERGYQRIGIVVPGSADGRVENFRRLQAARGWLEAQPRANRLRVFEWDAFTPLDLSAFEKWVQREKPEALAVLHAGIGRMLQGAGIGLPFAVMAGGSNPDLAGMDHRGIREKETIQLFDRLIRSASYGLPERMTHHVFMPDWLDGPSLPVRSA